MWWLHACWHFSRSHRFSRRNARLLSRRRSSAPCCRRTTGRRAGSFWKTWRRGRCCFMNYGAKRGCRKARDCSAPLASSAQEFSSKYPPGSEGSNYFPHGLRLLGNGGFVRHQRRAERRAVLPELRGMRRALGEGPEPVARDARGIQQRDAREELGDGGQSVHRVDEQAGSRVLRGFPEAGAVERRRKVGSVFHRGAGNFVRRRLLGGSKRLATE